MGTPEAPAMPARLITQSAVVLLTSPPGEDDLGRALQGLGDLRPVPPGEGPLGHWLGGSPAFALPWRPEVHGTCVVDVIPQRWPDDMGDPKTSPELFGAWVMAQFGPLAYPGGLERASRFSADPEPEREHRAVVRIRTTYAAGASPEDLVVPEDYDPLAELWFASTVAQKLLALPGALAYFNPNGEVLLRRAEYEEILAYHAGAGLQPLPAWVGMHLFAPEEHPGQRVMTTVGMEQLDVPDHELWLQEGSAPFEEVSRFLWNAAEYVRTSGREVRDGDTMDGPGGTRWVGRKTESLGPRPRQVYRWSLPRRKRWFGLFG